MPRDVASWTLNRNFRNSVDSQIDDKSLHRLSRQSGGVGKMRYDLIASDDEILQASSAGLKRTKSFWKFGGGRNGEDILAGMSLWQHRDLVAAPNLEEMRDRDDLERRLEEDRNGTLTKSHNSSSSQEKRERKDSLTSTELYGDEDENIYGVSPQQPPLQQQTQQHQQHQQHQQQQAQQHRSSYTPKSRMKIMKTIEIDIEEPTEAERMSTMRRGQSQDQQQQHRKLDKQVSGTGSQHKSLTLSRTKSNQQQQQQQQFPQSTDEGESDEHGTLKLSDVNNFFDGEGKNNSHGHGLVMKTVKRQDILKQYYTSEDEEDSDAELKSTSSDPYDCIVINDHLVRKDDKMRRHHQQQHQQMATNTLKKSSSKDQDSTLTRNSTASSGAPTATILPRTRLLKSSTSAGNNIGNSSATLERNSKGLAGNKSYGPWYDFWDQEQHGQKSASAKLK